MQSDLFIDQQMKWNFWQNWSLCAGKFKMLRYNLFRTCVAWCSE